MATYIARRLLQSIPILLGITVLTFLLAKAMPGDPFSTLLNPGITRGDLERLRGLAGLKAPLHIQYLRWLGALIQGNFGMSIVFNQPVSATIAERIAPTVAIGTGSLIIGLVLGILFGVISAVRKYTLVDNIVTVGALAGISAPTFFMGLLAIKYLSIGSGWFPSSNLVTPGLNAAFPYNYLDVAHHLVLPTTVLGVASIGGMARYVRSGLLDVLGQDYVRTARSKGLHERVVVYRHALRNALIPVVTILGLSLPTVIGGAIITEQVFSIPGMGRLTFLSVIRRDYPLIMATTVLFAVLTVVGNLLADVAYAWVDPRIRYD
ncbi:MAG TPA: ABC transporter permease [Bacillota bacterium]